MDSPTFVKRVAELRGVDKEIAERVERVDGLLTGTRLDDLLERALELAREAAGDADVEIAGGANLVQQYLLAGLLDELELHHVPVLLGGGVRMFDRPGLEAVTLAPNRVVASPAVTHVRFDVVR
jgi:dihydrofolate reductase